MFARHSTDRDTKDRAKRMAPPTHVSGRKWNKGYEFVKRAIGSVAATDKLQTNLYKRMKFREIRVLIFTMIVGASYCHGQDRTAPKLETNPQALNFILMGDWGRNGADHQKEVASKMGEVASVASVDFIISAGDNFYPSGVASEHDPLWHYSYENIYTDFSLQWNWYPVLGNHDYGSNPEAQVKYSAISRRWQMPSRYYTKHFNLNGDSAQSVLIIFVDTTPLIRHYYAGQFHKVHDQDSTRQKIWIEEQLVKGRTAKWKFIVGHHPAYTGGGRTESNDTRSIRRVLEPLMEKYGVDGYLSGHEHSLQHIGPVKSVHHFISGAASERTPARMLPISKFARSEYGFMLFSITSNKMLVQVIDYKGNVIYKTDLNK